MSVLPHWTILPSFLWQATRKGQRGCDCRYKLCSPVGLLARLKCERLGVGRLFWGKWAANCDTDGSGIQITCMVMVQVIPHPSRCSGQPLMTHRWFPAGKISPGAKVYSVSSRKFWSGNCSVPNLVRAHGEQISQWDWRTRGITSYKWNDHPHFSHYPFTNLGEPSASPVPHRTARKASRSCSVNIRANNGVSNKKTKDQDGKWKNQQPKPQYLHNE